MVKNLQFSSKFTQYVAPTCIYGPSNIHIFPTGGWHPLPPPGRWSKRIVSPQMRRAPMPVDASVEIVTVNLGFLGGTISWDTERHFTEVKTLYLPKLCSDTDSVLFMHSCVTYSELCAFKQLILYLTINISSNILKFKVLCSFTINCSL